MGNQKISDTYTDIWAETRYISRDPATAAAYSINLLPCGFQGQAPSSLTHKRHDFHLQNTCEKTHWQLLGNQCLPGQQLEVNAASRCRTNTDSLAQTHQLFPQKPPQILFLAAWGELGVGVGGRGIPNPVCSFHVPIMTAGSRAVELLDCLLCAWSWDLSWCLGHPPASASPNHKTINPMSLSQWQSMPTFLLPMDAV